MSRTSSLGLVVVSALATLLSCAHPAPRPAPSRARPRAEIADTAPSPSRVEGARASSADTALPERIDVDTAIDLALERHPGLRASLARATAAEGLASQAGRLPNPSLDVAAENARVSGRFQDGIEYLAGLRQAIPLGGRLSAEHRAQDSERRAAAQRHEAARRRLVSSARSAFFDALHAGLVLEIERRRVEIAGETARLARELRDAGDATAEDLAHAELNDGRARLRLEEAARANADARGRLATMLGTKALGDARLEGDLADVAAVDIDAMLARLESHPELVAARELVSAEQARVELQRAMRVPDVEVFGLYRRIRVIDAGDDIDAVDFGFSIPLPIFDRRSGAIRAAEARLDEAMSDAEFARMNVDRRAREIAARSRETSERVRILSETIEPAAMRVLEALEARRREGDSSLLDVLDARESRWQAARDLLDARRELANMAAELGYLADE